MKRVLAYFLVLTLMVPSLYNWLPQHLLHAVHIQHEANHEVPGQHHNSFLEREVHEPGEVHFVQWDAISFYDNLHVDINQPVANTLSKTTKKQVGYTFASADATQLAILFKTQQSRYPPKYFIDLPSSSNQLYLRTLRIRI